MSSEAPLPEAVATGEAPFVILGAMAGGWARVELRSNAGDRKSRKGRRENIMQCMLMTYEDDEEHVGKMEEPKPECAA